MSDWNKEQQWEKEWHGNCVNSYNEETKQFVYARKMGLRFQHDGKTPYNFDMEQKSILDIGAGPYSLLLKCSNFSKATAADPCDYPKWVYERYHSANIETMIVSGEKISLENIYDEVWIYNVLQHVQDPEKIIQNAKNHSKIIRLFEWIENGISPGHPHNLTKIDLDKWLGGDGKAENLNESGCVGLSYYGIFKGNHYNG